MPMFAPQSIMTGDFIDAAKWYSWSTNFSLISWLATAWAGAWMLNRPSRTCTLPVFFPNLLDNARVTSARNKAKRDTAGFLLKAATKNGLMSVKSICVRFNACYFFVFCASASLAASR